MMPRLVFERGPPARRLTAARIVAPSGALAGRREGRADRHGARQEVLVARVVEVAPGRDVARLGRADLEQAGELTGGGHLVGRVHAARAGELVDHGAGHVDPGRRLQALPAGNPVDLEHVHRAVARRQQVDAGVLGADRRRRPHGERAPCLGELDGPRRPAAGEVRAPAVRTRARWPPAPVRPTTNARISRPSWSMARCR